MDNKRRSIAKTLSWRFIACVITTGVVYVTSYILARENKAEFAATIGLLDTTIKLGVYYFHERAWNRVNFGREIPKASEYEI